MLSSMLSDVVFVKDCFTSVIAYISFIVVLIYAIESISSSDICSKYISFTKKLKKDAQRLGFDVDFDSFCTMLQNYVNIKDSMEDKEKKEYLEVLTKLSICSLVNVSFSINASDRSIISFSLALIIFLAFS